MNRFFLELQNKPYRYRRNVALGFACGITIIIFFVWVISTKERFNAHLQRLAEKAATSTAVAEPASPLEAISRTFSEGFDTIQKQFEELSKLAK